MYSLLRAEDKMIFCDSPGNMMELQLLQQDKKMKMHPVVVLFGVALFGFIWGPTGMIVCVPVMATIKGIAVDFKSPFPESLRSFVLQLLEGDTYAHERHSEASLPLLPYHVPSKDDTTTPRHTRFMRSEAGTSTPVSAS